MEYTKPLFELTDTDRRVYTERLSDFLPDELIDIHTHVWRTSDFPPPTPSAGEARIVTWPSLVAAENPIENLRETYRILFPDKRVTPLIFGTTPEGGNLDIVNSYVEESAHREHLPSLIYSDPAWSADELESRIIAGGFLGAKSYLTLAPAYLPVREIRIFDFFPPHQLAMHERHGWIVMLHIPRDGRLKDTVNLAQLLQIEHDYPKLNIVIAHVGRAYCNEDIGNAFELLAGTKHLCFDISANTNDYVFEQLIQCVGPQRILFGSDLPISRMRMRRITHDGRYINLVPHGLYGDVAGDPNMAEVDGTETEQLTLFLYEEIDAFRRAAEHAGLKRSDVKDVFFNNARRLIDNAG
jgi:hypothetical protein